MTHSDSFNQYFTSTASWPQPTRTIFSTFRSQPVILSIFVAQGHSFMRNLADTGIALPKNSEFLDFPKTDGNASTWPTNTTRVVDNEGHVNYYEYVPPEHSQHVRWRMLIGDAIGLKLNLPVGPTYVLRNFPDDYRLFDHNKGPQAAPRHDLYLFGPIKKRFRSVNEFIPHAIWLMGDTSQDCECKYCAKKSQREITASMSNILRMTPSQSPSPKNKPTRDKGKGKERETIPRFKLPRPREPRAYVGVQRVVKPLKPSPGIIQQPMLVERNNDLRAIFTQTSMHLHRWFRDGEVVWCALDNPISGPDGSMDGAIEFWPAVIEEIKLKTEPIPRDASDAVSRDPPSSAAIQVTSSTMQTDPPMEGDTRGPMLENSEEPLPWIIRQFTRYKVQLLAVSHSYTVDDAMVLPYQAYVPPNDLITNMTEFPPEKLDFDRDSLLKFNPCSNPTPVFSDAVSAFATAVQIASIISTGWCLTDDYTVRYSMPTPSASSPQIMRRPSSSQSASSSSQPPLPPMTLQAAIESASRHNFQISRNVTSVNSEMSNRETSKVASSVLGTPPPPIIVEQTRFQGLWWGAERIWTDDFIRLKVPRSSISPYGGTNLLPASGPGKSLAAQWIDQGRDPAELGAATRGLFLRLDAMITIDIVNDQGVTKKEARVCGMLYELADEDWDDPAQEPSMDTSFKVSLGPSSSHLKTTELSSQGPSPANSASNLKVGQQPIFNPAQEKLLPPPPAGFKFRPVINPGYEFVGAMGLISGRYYPGILSHPKTKSLVQEAIANPIEEEKGVAGFDNIWALEGLSGGYYNSTDPHRYKKSRVVMMQDADKQALDELQNYARSRLEGNDEDAMEVDI